MHIHLPIERWLNNVNKCIFAISGAAATTTRAEIEMIVFLAIMLHKAPAAFALVSFLLHEGLDRTTIKRHLLLFSAAAPILAMTTYFGISQNTKVNSVLLPFYIRIHFSYDFIELRKKHYQRIAHQRHCYTVLCIELECQ